MTTTNGLTWRGPEKGTAEYRKAYERGWRSRNLEGGDARGEPDAWYDGYYDAAAGRPKWTLMRMDEG